MSDQQMQLPAQPQAQPESRLSLAGEGETLAVYGDRKELRELAARVKLMIQNGKKLQDHEAMALAQYAIATGLNPFIGECWYLPDIGPSPGIAGWRKKADDQLDVERVKAREPYARWWVEFVEPSENEAQILNVVNGDIAVHAILHDTLTKNEWERRLIRAIGEFMKCGLGVAEARAAALDVCGKEPTWDSLGIVGKDENFGRYDKMPRLERAKKRAEKACIRKRFPQVNLPEHERAEFEADIQFVDEGPLEKAPRSIAQNMADLGYA